MRMSGAESFTVGVSFRRGGGGAQGRGEESDRRTLSRALRAAHSTAGRIGTVGRIGACGAGTGQDGERGALLPCGVEGAGERLRLLGPGDPVLAVDDEERHPVGAERAGLGDVGFDGAGVLIGFEDPAGLGGIDSQTLTHLGEVVDACRCHDRSRSVRT